MLLAEETEKKKVKRKKRKTIPKELIYEMRNGKAIYYRDYEKVLLGEKTLEETMGSGKLQAWIIEIILNFLLNKIERKKYKILLNEIGYQWKPKTWRNLDIAIFNRASILKEGIDNKYVKTPPEIVIEVDTKADLSKHDGLLDLYMREKTQDLLDSGVKKVIWFTTADKKVMYAENGKSWLIDKWKFDMELMDGIVLNLGKLIDEEGIEI